jgi:hypothetical protein
VRRIRTGSSSAESWEEVNVEVVDIRGASFADTIMTEELLCATDDAPAAVPREEIDPPITDTCGTELTGKTL